MISSDKKLWNFKDIRISLVKMKNLIPHLKKWQVLIEKYD